MSRRRLQAAAKSIDCRAVVFAGATYGWNRPKAPISELSDFRGLGPNVKPRNRTSLSIASVQVAIAAGSSRSYSFLTTA